MMKIPNRNLTNNLEFKQGRQCTYNVILRRVRLSLLPWKSNKYYIAACVCACESVGVPERVGLCLRV